MSDSNATTFPWLKQFTDSKDPLHGYVRSLDDVDKLIANYERATVSKFAVSRTEKKGFGKTDTEKDGSQKIYWSDTHIPFIIVNSRVHECQHGKDRNKSHKEKRKNEAEKREHDYKNKARQIQETKKFGCSARILIKEIVEFPDFKLNNASKWQRRTTSTSIRQELAKENASIDMKRLFNIALPKQEDHSKHVTGKAAAILQPLDSTIIDQINEYVADGVTEVSDMQRHLTTFVRLNLKEQANTENRRFFPSDKVVRDHMYIANLRQVHSRDDQKNLQSQVDLWMKKNPDDKFFYRPKSEVQNTENCEQKLLFVYQSQQHRRLLSRYGKICLLDATYKTTKYALPLFFVCVKTNVDYQVVGSFVCENESTDSILEGIQILSDWNNGWNPSFFMTDFDEKEINAIETVFPSCEVYLCDFHREQAWTRWVNKREHNVYHVKEEVLARLRKIANADTEQAFEEAVQSLQQSSVWELYPSFKNWFSNYWYPHHKRWVWAFRQNSFQVLIKTNNGIERQNKSFKYEYLRRKRKNTLSRMITVLVEQFFPRRYQRYATLNAQFSSGYRKYKAWVPHYLVDRPRKFTAHCMEKIALASRIPSTDIFEVKEGVIRVGSTTENSNGYVVKFEDDDDGMPSCECYNWKEHFLPCKHMFAIILQMRKYSWESLPEAYRNSPYFTLDEEFALNVERATDSDLGETKLFEDTNVFVEPESCDDTSSHQLDTLELPLPAPFARRSDGAACRDALDQLRGLTFSIVDRQALHDLTEELNYILERTKSNLAKEDELVIETNVIKTRKRYTNNDVIGIAGKKPRRDEKPSMALPKETKRMKHERVGVRAEKEFQNKSGHLDIKTGIIAETKTKKRTYIDGKGVPREIKLTEESQVFSENEIEVSDTENDCPLKINDNAFLISDEDEATTSSSTWLCIGNNQLKEDEKAIMSSQDMWLNDSIINAAQHLMRDKYPHIDGLQDPILQQNLSFRVQTGEFVQILNKGNNHWFVATNIGLSNMSAVRIFDSLGGKRFDHEIQKVIASLLYSDSSEILLKIEDVQNQKDGHSCGLFAIAFAVSLCYGEDPRKIMFVKSDMRNHLLACLMKREIEPFPRHSKERKPTLGNSATISIHCTCRLPFDPDDIWMALTCCLCNCTYHAACVSGKKKVVIRVDGREKWICEKCSRASHIEESYELINHNAVESTVRQIEI